MDKQKWIIKETKIEVLLWEQLIIWNIGIIAGMKVVRGQ